MLSAIATSSLYVVRCSFELKTFIICCAQFTARWSSNLCCLREDHNGCIIRGKVSPVWYCDILLSSHPAWLRICAILTHNARCLTLLHKLQQSKGTRSLLLHFGPVILSQGHLVMGSDGKTFSSMLMQR